MACDIFHILEGCLDIIVVVFHRGRHVAGDDLRCIMIETYECSSLGVQSLAVAYIADGCQCVGYHAHLQAVLTQILLAVVPHECPSVNIFHS